MQLHMRILILEIVVNLLLLSSCRQEDARESSFAQEAELSCIELYKLDIKFDERKNTPDSFKFTHNGKKIADSIMTLHPILKAIDYDGFIQFKSQKGIHAYHISYVDPGEESTKQNYANNVVAVNSLNEKTDSVRYGDMWGTGNLFSQRFLFAEKIQEVRFLLPLITAKSDSHALVGYACSNWHKLREVDDPAKCYEEKRKAMAQKKKNTQYQANETMKRLGISDPGPKYWENLELLMECE